MKYDQGRVETISGSLKEAYGVDVIQKFLIDITVPIIPNLLKEAYRQIIPDTMLHASEIQAERLRKRTLRNIDFITADCSIFYHGGNHPIDTRDSFCFYN